MENCFLDHVYLKSKATEAPLYHHISNCYAQLIYLLPLLGADALMFHLYRMMNGWSWSNAQETIISEWKLFPTVVQGLKSCESLQTIDRGLPARRRRLRRRKVAGQFNFMTLQHP
jgi:hypothetical protein